MQYDVLHQEFGGDAMTFGGFDVDTAVLRRQGQNFTDLGDDFAKASKQLESALEGLGEPWSDADFGDVFGEIYTPIRDGILASMDSLAERLQQIGHTLQDNARTYDASDTSNSGLLSGIAGQL
ncbi:WXG100 family type VII secretion target [Streptomyces sp. NPDC101117]|uniref:WXG100 family type VII secretion target n=1 Tax=Streptomyces sp. NPDC101117 TaxID=3366108 RepID=UPI0037F92F5C